MDVGIPSPQAILIISFNIFRVLCRRYGLYVIFGVIILAFQGFSGYYILYHGIDQPGIEEKPSQRSDRLARKADTGNVKSNFDWSLHNVDHVLSNDISSKSENELSSNSYISNRVIDETSKPNEFGISLPCKITNKEVLSALQRAKTVECKEKIANISCEVERGKFYPSRLVSFCPTFGRIRGRFVGCFQDSVNDRLLAGFMVSLQKNSPSVCADLCFQRGFVYAGVQFSKECFCGNSEVPSKARVSDGECNMPCAGTDAGEDIRCGGYLRISVIETGLAKVTPKPLRKPTNSSSPSVRIAYILTVNGRSYRQVLRLFKTLFHQDHYFFIHVDSRQHYLFRELLRLEETFENVLLSRQRFSSIWGGSSLLKVLLHCMKELLLKNTWHWDFVINLSESDFPIKSNEALVNFLTANKERNFLKSHGHDTNKFLQKQGLDRTFLECETHMWRIGGRKLPLGIRIDGGSDWVCLNRQFVEYVTLSNDDLVNGLKKVFTYTLLPGESFFHTVLRNSEYCQTFTDNNLHVTNWKRKLGCRCQYKHIVDWCGCSPNDFIPGDWAKLEASKNRNLFFGRKFEAVKSLEAINKMDETLYGKYDPSTPSLNSFWENVYHFEDRPSGKEDQALTLFYSATRLCCAAIDDQIAPDTARSQQTEKCHLLPVLPTQVFSFHVSDHFQGLVVEFMARTKSGFGMKFEAFLQQKDFVHIHHTFLTPRLNKVEVNTLVDLKEQMFRNFGGHLGPQSDVTIALWVSAAPVQEDTGHERDENEQESETVVDVVLVDPVDAVAARTQLVIGEAEEMVTHTFKMEKPLRPGFWRAHVLAKGQILASVKFPILRLQFVQGRQISVAEARNLHGGPSQPYSDVAEDTLTLLRDLRLSSPLPHLFPGNRTKFWEENERALQFGPKLLKLIDNLVSESYTFQGFCLVSPEKIPRCLRGSITPCSKNPWSSHSPDPKSFVDPDIDAKTGRLREKFRLLEHGS